VCSSDLAGPTSTAGFGLFENANFASGTAVSEAANGFGSFTDAATHPGSEWSSSPSISANPVLFRVQSPGLSRRAAQQLDVSPPSTRKPMPAPSSAARHSSSAAAASYAALESLRTADTAATAANVPLPSGPSGVFMPAPVVATAQTAQGPTFPASFSTASEPAPPSYSFALQNAHNHVNAALIPPGSVAPASPGELDRVRLIPAAGAGLQGISVPPLYAQVSAVSVWGCCRTKAGRGGKPGRLRRFPCAATFQTDLVLFFPWLSQIAAACGPASSEGRWPSAQIVPVLERSQLPRVRERLNNLLIRTEILLWCVGGFFRGGGGLRMLSSASGTRLTGTAKAP
jgi:hypothetical protein